MNLVGAVGLAINSGWNGAWPSAGLNIVWLGIAILAMRRNRRLATP
jgi:Na+/proline symporter